MKAIMTEPVVRGIAVMLAVVMRLVSLANTGTLLR
jgi:hypothetical protein